MSTKTNKMFTDHNGALKSFSLFVLAMIICFVVGLTHAFSETIEFDLPEGTYAATMWVDGFTNDTIVFVDGAGLYWEYESEQEDWFIGDPASMIMYDNGTPESIYDDIMLTYPRYAGIGPKDPQETLPWYLIAIALVTGVAVGFAPIVFTKIHSAKLRKVGKTCNMAVSKFKALKQYPFVVDTVGYVKRCEDITITRDLQLKGDTDGDIKYSDGVIPCLDKDYDGLEEYEKRLISRVPLFDHTKEVFDIDIWKK